MKTRHIASFSILPISSRLLLLLVSFKGLVGAKRQHCYAPRVGITPGLAGVLGARSFTSCLISTSPCLEANCGAVNSADHDQSLVLLSFRLLNSRRPLFNFQQRCSIMRTPIELLIDVKAHPLQLHSYHSASSHNHSAGFYLSCTFALSSCFNNYL